MKIVHIIPSFNVGGGELLAVRLCAEIKRQMPHYEIFIISLYDPMPTIVYDEALASGAIVKTLGKRKGFDWNCLIKLSQLLNEIYPDVIHTHLAGLRYSAFPSFPFRRCVKIHTVHSMADNEASPIIRLLQKAVFKHLNWVPVALSETLRLSINEIYGIDPPVIFNGIRVDESVHKMSKELCRARCNIQENHFVIIAIGRLYKQKNQSLLIDVFEDVFKKSGNCSLLIVGEDPVDGSYRKMLEDKIDSLSKEISKNIYLLGQRKDIPQLLRASDLFILTSDVEGMPLTLLEAMGYGVPSVCTAVGGIPDMLIHEKEGLLAPRGDKTALVDAVLRIIRDPIFAAQLASNAKKKFSLEYRVEIVAERYIRLYKLLLYNRTVGYN